MARVFISMYNFGRKTDDFEAMPPFYEAFVQGFKNAGNKVLCFHHKTFERQFTGEIPTEFKEKLLSFNPDLCILFCNNFWDISELIDCPIVIYDVDSPLVYSNRDVLVENVGRYKFVVNNSNGIAVLQDAFGADKEQICYIPFFTEIRAYDKVDYINNISFIGTNWLWKGYGFLQDYLKKNPSNYDRKLASKVIAEYIQYPFHTSQTIYNNNRWHPHERLELGDLTRTAVEISAIKRVRVLSALADLGLEIRGKYWDLECMKYFPELMMAFNPIETYTIKDNEEFLNASKISISTKHIQAINGFSFRICDVMASKACLVAEYSADIDSLFHNVGVPMFSSPSEAREQCLKLINNENLRKEIVAKANELMDRNFRFRNVLEKLEYFLNMRLTSEDDDGDLTIFSDECDKIVKEEENKEFLSKIKGYLGKGYHNYPTKYLSIGKINMLKVISIRNNEKHVYSGVVPLLKLIQKEDGISAQLLLWNKMGKLCKLMFNKSTRIKRNCVFKSTHNINQIVAKRRLRNKFKRGNKITVCLFTSRITDWQFSKLYDLLDNSNIFYPYVVVKPFVSQGKDAMISFMDTAYETLKNKGYRVYRTYDVETDSYMDLRGELNPDVLFYTMYWRPHFHENFYIKKFLDKVTFFTSYAYDCVKHDDCMNFELNNRVSKYFIATSLHKGLAETCMDNGGRNVVAVGSPKMDVFLDREYKAVNVWKKQSSLKKRIIWAPHHSDHYPEWQYQFNSFYEICDTMFDIAMEYRDYIQIAFKPHPMLKAKLVKLWGYETTIEYYQKWATLENGQLEEGPFTDLFLTSDAMILDSASFIAEYTIVNKPALFTIGKTSRVYLNDFGKMNFEVLYHAEGDLRKEISLFIDNVILKGRDVQKSKREQFIKEWLTPPNGKSATENIYDCMYQCIFGKKGESD